MQNDVTLPPVVQDPLIGTTIQDRYRVIKKLGEGGMGAVYLGEHLMIKRKVAIKCLHSQFASHPEVVARFHREALAATSIGNEHIVEVTDMGTFDDGTLFMVLEYLEGRDFSTLIEEEGPQPLGRVIAIMIQMCDALTAVHAKGIVHRDLKPDNVFLVPRGGNPDFVKILDFGISKFKNSLDGKTAKMTATGSALGTPYFMSPEQAEGCDTVDHRSDIYALGCIMFNALTGRQAFQAETISMVILNICTKDPPSICELRPDIPMAFEAVLNRTLAKDKNQRFVDTVELKAALIPFWNENKPAPSKTEVESRVKEIDTFADTGVSFPKLASGSDLNKINVEEAVSTGGVSREMASASQSGGITQLPAKSTSILLWAVVGLVIIMGVALVGILYKVGVVGNQAAPQTETPLDPMANEATAPTSSPTNTPASAPVTETVQIKITTVPKSAELFLDGAPISNPFDAELPKSDTPRKLEAKAAGFASKTQTLALQFSQKVVVTLIRVNQTESPSGSSPRKRAGASKAKSSGTTQSSTTASSKASTTATTPTATAEVKTQAPAVVSDPKASSTAPAVQPTTTKKESSGLKSLF